jgi:hypothetical protein
MFIRFINIGLTEISSYIVNPLNNSKYAMVELNPKVKSQNKNPLVLLVP